MSGDNSLLFSFGKTGELERNFEFIRSKVLESEWRQFHAECNGAPEVRALDAHREEMDRMTSAIYDANRAIPFSKSVGIKNAELPCLAIWVDFESSEFITYSFDNDWVVTGHIREHFKAIFDAIDAVLDKDSEKPSDDGSILKAIAKKWSMIKFKKFVKRRTTNATVANIIKAIGTGASVA